MAERIIRMNAENKNVANESCIGTDSVHESGMKNFINRLHEALDFYQLFDTFICDLRQVVPCDSIEYKDELSKTSLINGAAGEFKCQYALTYDQRSLGNLCITRDTEFAQAELEIMEVMLAGLVLPLRNALRFQQVIRFAQRDELTGLRNGSYYHDIVELEIKRAQRYKKPFSLLMFDLDDFEGINKRYGKRAGDALLIEVARRIEKKARHSDVVYRNGGDEFLVFLPHTSKSEALEAATRIKDYILCDTCKYKDNDMVFTVSAGVVTVTYDDTASKLFDRVNTALYHAKILGKNRIYGEASDDNRQSGQL